MQWLVAAIALAFAVLAVLRAGGTDALWWMPCYSLGMLLAALSFKRRLNPWMLRFLAVASTVAMFFYFAGFFALAPYMRPDWFNQPEGREAAGLLFAAFAMIPVLSVYSCRMKANCPHTAHIEHTHRSPRTPQPALQP